jgi:hypothetical protein
MKPPRPTVIVRRRLKRDAASAERDREKQRIEEQARRELAKRHVLVNVSNLRPTNSYDAPEFAQRGYYVDRPFNCKACGVAQIWTETQQKWWYESAKGDVWTVAILCKPCRQRERDRKAVAREVHLSGLAAKGKRPA